VSSSVAANLQFPRGRLLGIDPGKVRVGLAVSDVERRLASPLETYVRRGQEADAVYFRNIAAREEITGLVIGLPVHNDGREGEQAVAARAFGRWLAETTGLPVVFWDERFTTLAAEEWLLSAGLTHKKRKARRDRVAAQLILQGYLDAAR
jgi:putative pre-16S rRNA nuclease